MSRGPVINRGSGVHSALTEFAIETARAEGIPFQVEAAMGRTYTDADAVALSRAGVPCSVVSIPNRYMHSPNEIVDLDDLEATAALVAAIARRLERVPGSRRTYDAGVPRSIALALVVAAASLIGIVYFYGKAHEATLSPQAVSQSIPPQHLDRPAPAFHADTIGGQPVDLADYAGKPLVINFFASWCPPCRQDAPRIAALARGYRGRVRVLGVAGEDTRSGVDHFVTRYGWHFPDHLGPALRPLHDVRHRQPAGDLHRRFPGPRARAVSGAGRPDRGTADPERAARVNASPTELSVAFAAGLAGVASPCMLPLVPGYLSFVSGVSATDLADRRRQVATSAGAFVLGFGAVFTAAGAGAGLLGAQFVSHRRGLELVGGVLVVTFGLILLLPPAAGCCGSASRSGGALAATSERCSPGAPLRSAGRPASTPTLGSILTIAGAAGHAAQGALLLAAYSLGMGIPIILAGLFFAEFLTASRPIRRHLDVITQVAGVVLVFTGILLATGRLEEITARLAQ